MLSDLDILRRLCALAPQERLIVTPLLDGRQIQPASIDLRLGFHFKVVKSSVISTLDPLSPAALDLGLETERYTYDIKLGPGQPFYIHPGEFALGTTLEFVGLPADLAARLDGRSSLGRLGITVHSTAGFVDPGFRGRITLEIQNEGTAPVALYPGMRVAQLCLFQLDSPAVRAYGQGAGSKYNYQVTTTSSRWYDDRDLRYFRHVFSVGDEREVQMRERLEQLGKLLEDIPPSAEAESDLAHLPPPGAARFVRKTDESFIWSPIPKDEWQRLPAAERAEIMIERGVQWLQENGDHVGSPLAFLGEDSGADSLIFDRQIQKLREAICIAHEVAQSNPKKAKVLELALGTTLSLVTGIPESHFAPSVFDLLLTFYGERICRQPK
jgi:dCTP deaminase